MPAPFPHHYKTQITAIGDRLCTIESAPRPTIIGGAPPEFDGIDAHWSPEHLLLCSVGLCLELTFSGVAKKARLNFKSWEIT